MASVGFGTLTYSREIPVAHVCDVLVVGGGPAGIAASIAAARNGARTLLVEQYGALGGMGTVGLVGPFMTSFSADGKHQVIAGIFDELVRRMVALGGALHPSQVQPGSSHSGFIVRHHGNVTPFDPETLKYVAAEMVLEAGVELLLHTFAFDVLTEKAARGVAVAGVVTASKSGARALRAKVVIDCTGDADVATLAGAPTDSGRPKDGKMQPMTLFFRVANVDGEQVRRYVRQHPKEKSPFESIVAQGRAAGEWPDIPRERVGIYESSTPGEWRVNTSRLLDLDGTKAEDLTRGEVEGRRQVHALMSFLRRRVPGFAEARLVDTAAQVGVRETRRIVGDYVLTVEDICAGRRFPDTIALCAYGVDVHNPEGPGQGRREDYETANVYEIPYRCLLPRGVEQLLVAGRCVSATHEAAGAIRVMPPCYATGQAAGTAAALAVRAGQPPRNVDVGELRRLLAEQRQILEV